MSRYLVHILGYLRSSEASQGHPADQRYLIDHKQPPPSPPNIIGFITFEEHYNSILLTL
jgi:hypothetical protein